MSRPGFTYPSCFATIKYHALRCGRTEREVYDVLDQIRFTFQYDPKFAQMDKDLKRYNTDLNMRNYFVRGPGGEVVPFPILAPNTAEGQVSGRRPAVRSVPGPYPITALAAP